MSYTLPNLHYSYDALEPHIDAKTMEIHHSKHHNAYITNLNKAIEDAKFEAPEDVNDLIKDLKKVPEAIRTAVRNNAGGHSNHSFFWNIISQHGGGTPTNDLASAIESTFGGFLQLKDEFTKAALTRFGSGWAWLCTDSDGELFVTSTPNQDSPLMTGIVEKTGTPIIGLDVWEHAYYLHYQNRRPDYVSAFWNVVDWNVAHKNFKKAIA